jgi:hypothetical protein
MAFTKPLFSLGLPIVNGNFQLPSDTSGLASGWSIHAGSATFARAFYGSRIGRHSAQLISTATPAGPVIKSPPANPLYLSIVQATKILGVLDIADNSTGNTVTLQIGWYNSAGAALGSLATLVTTTTPIDALLTAEITATPPATAAFARLFIEQGHTVSGTQNTYIFFAGAGCWNAAIASYFQPTRFPIHPGTTGKRVTLDPGRYRNEVGINRTVDRTRHARPNIVTLAFNYMPTSEMLLFQQLDGFNIGRNWDANVSALQNPTGGSWPILLLPGHSGLVNAMLCDMTSGCAMEPDENWGRQDPPYWQGAFEFAERT